MRFYNEHGAGEISPLPGCGQVAVSHAAFVFPEYRGKGKGRAQHRARLATMKKMGYDYALCTVVKGNARQEAILNTEGWAELAIFDSSYTGNTVILYGRAVRYNVINGDDNAEKQEVREVLGALRERVSKYLGCSHEPDSPLVSEFIHQAVEQLIAYQRSGGVIYKEPDNENA